VATLPTYDLLQEVVGQILWDGRLSGFLQEPCVAVRRMTSRISDDAARRVVMVSSEAAKGSGNGSFARSPVFSVKDPNTSTQLHASIVHSMNSSYSL
jgi:hypothetical protein